MHPLIFRKIFLSTLLLFLCASASATPEPPLNKIYGADKAQNMDIYLPKNPQAAPIIVMVHGGAWKYGDKNSTGVVKNKIAYWLPQGFIFISINYRLLPKADPLTQAKDVAQALRFIQTHAREWNGDANEMIVMGHSAGAHLVALLSASPTLLQQENILPWRGSVILDSAAMDVPRIMQTKHYRLYDQAFGENTNYWQQTSPIDQLQKNAIPMLLVCSSKREYSCAQAQSFNETANQLHVYTSVLSENLSHGDINKTLGEKSNYTQAVDNFIAAQLHH